jgi:S-formylglutathione hydrolase FrmB
MADVSLVTGAVPVAVLVAGALALLVLLARPGRAGLVTAVVALAAAALAFFGLDWLVTDGLNLFPEALPTAVTAWLAVATGAVVLVVGNLVGTRVGRKLVAIGSGLVVLVAAGSQVNVYFAEYPTLGALAASTEAEASPLTGQTRRASRSMDDLVVDRWTGPASGTSQVVSSPIPGTVSGFTGRDAYIYLPAAYSAPSPPYLPVLVLVAGQPGSPDDWIVSGQLQELLDEFAAANGGLAPVTVVVDPNGSEGGNTMCMDSTIARADTYLTQDVPNWIVSELGVDSNHAHWAFGGFSFGGTCAIQMATRHPDLYPSFADVSGEREPAISADRTQTVQTAFGGDTAAFDALTPLTLLGQRSYPDVWGYFAVGGDDSQFLPAMTEVSAAAQKAGMTVRTQIVAGQGHSWAVPDAALVPALEFLGPRLGLTRGSA